MAKGRQREVYGDENRRSRWIFKTVLSFLCIVMIIQIVTGLVTDFNKKRVLSEASHVYLDNVEVDKDKIDIKLYDYSYDMSTNSLYLVVKSKKSSDFWPIYVRPGKGF